MLIDIFRNQAALNAIMYHIFDHFIAGDSIESFEKSTKNGIIHNYFTIDYNSHYDPCYEFTDALLTLLDYHLAVALAHTEKLIRARQIEIGIISYHYKNNVKHFSKYIQKKSMLAVFQILNLILFIFLQVFSSCNSKNHRKAFVTIVPHFQGTYVDSWFGSATITLAQDGKSM